MLLIAFLLYQFCRSHRQKREEIGILPESCAACGEPEKKMIFCRKCAKRLLLKHITIFLGVTCFPIGGLVGYTVSAVSEIETGNAIEAIPFLVEIPRLPFLRRPRAGP